MRLDKLHLLRYGKFTDFTLDFGERRKNVPDLHIVYGPNEAGKTTLMTAYLDFLFGFPQQPTYNFKHANSALKVGGVITADDKTQTLWRLKKNKNSLVDSNEQPADDGILLQQLAGLGKQSYSSMFSLNDDTLEQGGESILASEGELGKLLYSATTGVAQLSEALLQMRTQSEQFYKKGKRKFELAELKKQLDQVNKERKSIDIEASAYSKLSKQRSQADAAYEALGAKKDKIKLDIQKLSIKKSAHPRLVSLKRLQAALLPLEKLPDTPTDWIDEVKQLHINDIQTATTESEIAKNIELIDKAIKPIVLDEAALSARQRWQQIEQERDNYLVATTNLPDLEQQLHSCNLDIAGHLHKLGQTDNDNPNSLILDATTQSRIKDLIKQYPDLISQLNAAKKELALAEQQNNESKTLFIQSSGNADSATKYNETEQENSAIGELELSIASLSHNEISTDFQTTLHKKEETQDDLDAIITKLTPWHGDTKTLLSLNIPHATELQALQHQRDDIAEQLNNESLSLKGFKKNLADLLSQQKSYTANGLVDDAESQRLRSSREVAWEKHKNTLDSNTADIFEQAMRHDDAGQASRLQHTQALAKLTQLSRDIVMVEESIANSESTLEQLSREQSLYIQKFDSLKENISPLLNSSMTIEAVNVWIGAHDQAIQALQLIKKCDRELAGIDSAASKACSHISAQIKRAGGHENTDTEYSNQVDRLFDLIKLANRTLKQHSSLAGLRTQVTNNQRQLDARKNELETTQQHIDQWTSDWKQACNSCWLGTTNTIPTSTVVDEFLQQLSPLEKQLTQKSVLDEKMLQLQKHIKNYGALLTSMASDLSIATKNVSTDQLFQSLFTRMEKAVAGQELLNTKLAQKNTLQEQQQTNQIKRTAIQASIAAKNAYFSVQSIDEVHLKIQDVAKKQELQKRIENEENELLELLKVSTITEAFAAFADFDSDKTQLELDKLDRAATDLDLELREAHTAQKDAHRALEHVGGDDTVALLNEQRANLLLEIEEKVTQFLQQHLALNAADAALKVYRDNHRSSMITNASDAFARMSQGRYIRLDTFQAGASEQLIAIDKDGASKVSSALSKGTRFQLYLALRIAGYHEYARSRPAVPFIADDILETSDDDRAHNVFEVLGQMASVGQVIYLTHHQHLCDIASRAVPGCTVHELG